MNETENKQSLDCSEQMADTEPAIVEDVSFSEEEESELLPREQDMETAADIVIKAEKAASPSATATEPGAVRICGTSEDAGPVRTTNEDPPSVIAVRDDMTELYDNFAEELDSVTQSIPLLVASLAREGSTMTVEALEERFKQITAMLVSLEQREKEFQSASQQKSNSSLTIGGQYSEALEQRFKQITDMLTCMQQQQVEAFRRYEESQSMNQHRPSFDEPSERTTSVASSFENESSQDLSALSMNTCCSDDPDAQLTQLTAAVAMIQRQQQELLDANRNRGGRSCRDRFEMFISCLCCLRTRPAYREES